MKPHVLARIGAGITVVVVFVALFLGRTLETQYPSFLPLIPFVGIFLLVLIVAISGYIIIAKLRTQHPAISLKKVAVHCSFVILVIVVSVVICEITISLLIERIHFIKYGLLAFFLFHSKKQGSGSCRVFFAVLLSSLLGIGEEVSQCFLPSRVFDYRDIVLNICGTLSGAFIAWSTFLPLGPSRRLESA